MDKTAGFVAAIVMLVATNGYAFAQAGTEGPLAAPADAPPAAAKPVKKSKHRKNAHHESNRALDGIAPDGTAHRMDAALPKPGTAAADPMSFGMKWNGNSDNARETRIQNYNAGAPGSGAEVGMRLHF